MSNICKTVTLRTRKIKKGTQLSFYLDYYPGYRDESTMKVQRRYTFYVSQPIANLATSIYENVKRGNSIFPLNQHEVQLRRDCFLRAYADLRVLTAQVEVAAELFDIEERVLCFWSQLIVKEQTLVKGVLQTDKERFKDLPE